VRTVVVIAGTPEEASDWIAGPHESDLRGVIVATKVEYLEGLMLAQGAVVYVGTWLTRPDLPQIGRRLEEMQLWWEHRLRRLGGES